MTKKTAGGKPAKKGLRKAVVAKTGLGQRIREIRVRLDLKQTELGQRLGVAAAAVSQWERDQLPSVDNLRQLAALGSTTLDWLLEGRDKFAERLASMSDDDLRILRD